MNYKASSLGSARKGFVRWMTIVFNMLGGVILCKSTTGGWQKIQMTEDPAIVGNIAIIYSLVHICIDKR